MVALLELKCRAYPKFRRHPIVVHRVPIIIINPLIRTFLTLCCPNWDRFRDPNSNSCNLIYRSPKRVIQNLLESLRKVLQFSYNC
jgi:hypothetical protein